jgi:hypothetical protein
MKRSGQKRRTRERKARQARAYALWAAAWHAKGRVVPKHNELSAFGRRTVAELYNKVQGR